MWSFFRKHAATVVVAAVTSFVFGGVPAMAHFTSITSHDLNHLDADYTKTYYRRSAPVTVISGNVTRVSVSCPSGTVAMGGGVYTELSDMLIEASWPSNGGSSAGYTGWSAWINNNNASDGDARAYVVCRKTFKPVNANYDQGDSPIAAGAKARGV